MFPLDIFMKILGISLWTEFFLTTIFLMWARNQQIKHLVHFSAFLAGKNSTVTTQGSWSHHRGFSSLNFNPPKWDPPNLCCPGHNELKGNLPCRKLIYHIYIYIYHLWPWEGRKIIDSNVCWEGICDRSHESILDRIPCFSLKTYHSCTEEANCSLLKPSLSCSTISY